MGVGLEEEEVVVPAGCMKTKTSATARDNGNFACEVEDRTEVL